MGLLDVMFGCSHKRSSFPITVRDKQSRTPAAAVTGTYIVCLDCGQEFPYDWNAMKLVEATPESGMEKVVPAYSGPKAA